MLAAPDVLEAMHPLVGGWFRDRFGAPTAAQAEGWPRIAAGDDVLIAAPTGSGKTLAAFLACLNELVCRGYAGPLPDHTSILYISPLKALSNDVHRNLEAPLAELAARAALQGDTFPEIRVAVRTGDTPAGERAKMAKKPPHILVTTPESLFILLTTVSGRAALGQLKTVIIDEIHAVAGDKRGAHLALSLERLDRLVTQTSGRTPVRVGLSATQRPIERIARLLVGMRRPMPHIVDAGHRREIDLAIEITDDELAAVASNEQFGRVYDRIAELVTQHRSTILFVNTRRLVERAAAALEQRLGEEHVVAHHGSMSRQLRHNAEQKLKLGQVKCAVATASLELGIDVGAVDLVIQLGSPRSIATLIQRVGRSGHHLGGTPKGRLFALTRDQLIECAALVRGVKNGNLDQIELRDAPLDILSQQIVATCAAEDLAETELAEMIRGATPYAQLSDERLEQIMSMLGEGVSDRRGRTGAYLHRDRVGGVVRARRSARLAAITSGGAIPDNNNYTVVQFPEETQVGTVDEDFAIDSSAGDVFQLGNTSWKIRRIEAGRVIVDDARGQPPTIPFWFGEAPARTRELSDEVSALRGEIDQRLATDDQDTIAAWLADSASMPLRAAQQCVAYLAVARGALGALPRKNLIIAERFFDEAGGMQLVIHAPLGGRINRAWGLALRKKFCVTFDFELQAVATDDGIVISLGQPHSFPLDTVFGYVPSHQARETLVQALLDRPMFEIRWRWNVTRALTVLRRRAGKRVPPHLVKMRAADTLSVVFPQALACGENIVGPREVPDHPLVFETVRDCLVEAMDLEGFTRLLEQLESGEIQVMAKDTVEPSPLSHELLNANPYAFLDDAPLEERRTRAVQLRRGLPPEAIEDAGALDEAAIAAAAEEVAPTVRDTDELHDALLALWLVPEQSAERLLGGSGAHDWFAALVNTGRACRLRWELDGVGYAAWVATERLGTARGLLGEDVECVPMIATPSWAKRHDREEALGKLVSAHLDHGGPISTRALAAELGLPLADVLGALLALEGDGAILRGTFTSGGATVRKTVRDALAAAGDTDLMTDIEWCNRRVLARIHRLTLAKLRREIEPVSPAALMRFYLRWQRVAKNTQLIGADGLARIVEQLQGFETAAGAWEREILPSRLYNYEAAFLDQMCLAGQVVWCRLSPRKSEVTDHLEPLTTDDAAALLAQLTKVASARDTIDAFPPLLRDAIKTGERVAARAIKAARAKKPANANRRALPAWVTSRGAVPRSPEPLDDDDDAPRTGTAMAAIDLPDWVAPAIPSDDARGLAARVHTNDRLPASVTPERARDDARGRDPAIVATIEATQTAASDAGATRQQVALAVTGVLARAFPMLEPLAAATLAFDAVFPPIPTRRNAPSRSAPLALMLRRDAAWLRAAAATGITDEPSLSPLASKIRDQLVRAGASFLPDLVGSIEAPPDAIEDALWELVGAGIATADGFASMRVLVDRRRGEVKSHFDRALERTVPVAPVRKWQEAIKKARTRDRERPAHAMRALPTAAGRWSLLPAAFAEALDVEASARQLLSRYGIVFRDLLARESSLPPWRDLLVVLRRLEARGEIRGGRFVNGFVGEQFALPEALDELRGVRNPGPNPEISRVSATDPLNLVGVLSPGPRVPAIVGNAVLYVDGQPVASLEGGEVVFRAPIPQGARIDEELAYHPPPRPVVAASQAALPL
jgi:ATP-dependent Lhr-like helicase